MHFYTRLNCLQVIFTSKEMVWYVLVKPNASIISMKSYWFWAFSSPDFAINIKSCSEA